MEASIGMSATPLRRGCLLSIFGTVPRNHLGSAKQGVPVGDRSGPPRIGGEGRKSEVRGPGGERRPRGERSSITRAS
jgi:hypothetical protein